MGGSHTPTPMLLLIRAMAEMETKTSIATPKVAATDYIRICSDLYGQYCNAGITAPLKAQCERQMIILFPCLVACLSRLLDPDTQPAVNANQERLAL